MQGSTGRVWADGAFFSNMVKHLYEPEQKAVIHWDGERESMILSARVHGKNIKELSRMAWVIPLESMDKPEVTPSDIDVFRTLVSFFKPQMKWGAYGAGLTVLEMKKSIFMTSPYFKLTRLTS